MSQTAMATAAFAVEARALSKRFGAFVAVDRVSFQIPRGAIFGFLGPNGAGKSTTIRMLCGLLTPTSGEATVHGFDLRTRAEEVKQHIGYMSQRFSLYTDLTVAENIEFYAGVYGIPRQRLGERLRWVLDLAGLEGRGRRLTGELAGGVRQRLALGCALVHEPPILFLDEPTGGVDPLSRRRFWDLIHGFAAEERTVFVTTHYMDEAEYCSGLGLIYRGKLVANGSPSQLKRQLGAEILEVECERPMDALAVLTATQARAAGIDDTTLFGLRLHVTVAEARAGEAATRRLLAAAGLSAASIRPIVPSLEDVFVSFIEREDRAASGAANGAATAEAMAGAAGPP